MYGIIGSSSSRSCCLNLKWTHTATRWGKCCSYGKLQMWSYHRRFYYGIVCNTYHRLFLKLNRMWYGTIPQMVILWNRLLYPFISRTPLGFWPLLLTRPSPSLEPLTPHSPTPSPSPRRWPFPDPDADTAHLLVSARPCCSPTPLISAASVRPSPERLWSLLLPDAALLLPRPPCL